MTTSRPKNTLRFKFVLKIVEIEAMSGNVYFT